MSATIVLGGDPNGLTAAAMLARQGRRVVLIEGATEVGGLARAEPFHDGFQTSGILSDTTGVWDDVIEALDLERHGLERGRHRPDVLVLGADRAFVVPGDPADAPDAMRDLGADATSYVRYRDWLASVRAPLLEFFRGPPVDLAGDTAESPWDLLTRAMRVRHGARRDLLELLRLPPMAVADWLDEWFEDDVLKAGLALPAVAHDTVGPRQPGTTMNLLAWEATAGGAIDGDGPALVRALVAACNAHGVELRTGTHPVRLSLEDGRVTSVTLDDGETLAADAVVATGDPLFLFRDLLPVGAVPARTMRRLEAFRARGTTAVVHFALRGDVRFDRAAGVDAHFARLAPGIDVVERAFDATKYGQIADRPVLDLFAPRGGAPEGHSVLTVAVHGAPHALRETWTETTRNALVQSVVALLEEQSHGFADRIVGSELLSPIDLERRYTLRGGNVRGGEHALDQTLVRPIPECSEYTTPIHCLFLGGHASHPGGGLSCAPGALATRSIIRT